MENPKATKQSSGKKSTQSQNWVYILAFLLSVIFYSPIWSGLITLAFLTGTELGYRVAQLVSKGTGYIFGTLLGIIAGMIAGAVVVSLLVFLFRGLYRKNPLQIFTKEGITSGTGLLMIVGVMTVIVAGEAGRDIGSGSLATLDSPYFEYLLRRMLPQIPWVEPLVLNVSKSMPEVFVSIPYIATFVIALYALLISTGFVGLISVATHRDTKTNLIDTGTSITGLSVGGIVGGNWAALGGLILGAIIGGIIGAAVGMAINKVRELINENEKSTTPNVKNSNIASELTKLDDLRKSGAITDSEYETAKLKLLS